MKRIRILELAMLASLVSILACDLGPARVDADTPAAPREKKAAVAKSSAEHESVNGKQLKQVTGRTTNARISTSGSVDSLSSGPDSDSFTDSRFCYFTIFTNHKIPVVKPRTLDVLVSGPALKC